MVESRGALVLGARVVDSTSAQRSKRSILALLLAGAAMTATPVGAVTYDLLGGTVNRSNFIDPTTLAESDFVENGTFNLTIAGNLTFNGVLRDGAGVLIFNKLGAGNLTLTGANTHSGETRITSGTITAGANNTLSANSGVRVGSVLELAGYDQTVRGFYQSGTISNTSGGTATLTTNPGVTVSFSGSLTDTAGNELTLVKAGAGRQDLIGVNTYSGGTILAGGTLGFGNSLSLGGGAVEITGAGATLHALGSNLTLANNIVLTANGVIDAAGLSPTLTGVISGAGSLTKIGSGSLTITNTGNSYSGGTFLQGGSVLLGGDIVLGDVNQAVVVGPASAIGTNGLSALLSNDIVANAQLTLLAPDAEVLDIAGVVSGAGNVLIQGSTGTVILRSANTYAGTTTLQGGTLGVGNDFSLGGADRSLFVSATATLRAYNNVSIANNLRLGADLTVDTNTYDMSLTDTVNNATAGLTGGLTKTGAGTLTLGVANNYSGGTTLRGGVLSVSANNRLGAATGGLTFDGGALRVTGNTFTQTGRAVTLLSTGEIEIVSAANAFTLSAPIVGAGGITKTGAGTLVFGTANSFVGGLTLNAGTVSVQDHDALGIGTATLNGGVLLADIPVLTLTNAITVGAGTIDTQANALTLAGTIGGGGTLTKLGAGTLTLSNTNSFAGGSFINAGEVTVGADGALGAGLATFADGTTLGTSANWTLGNAIQTNGTMFITTGANTLTLGGVVSGAGSIVKSDAGTLVLNGANSFAGPTTVAAGTVEVGTNTALGVGGATFSNGATLRAGVDGLTLTNAINLGGTGAVIDTNSFGMTLAGSIGGAQLTKAGAGTLTLSSANTYAGGTLLNMGRIAFSNDDAFGTSLITINAGGIDNTGNRTLANNILVNADTVSFLFGTLTLNGVLSGAERFTAANNTLALNGNNAGFSGGIRILNGIVQPGNDNAFGSGTIELGLGTIRNVSGATRTFANNVVLTNTGGVSGADDVVLNGIVSGGFGLDKFDAGTLTLANANSFTGGVNLQGGTVVVDTNTALGAGTLTTAMGTTVQFGTTPRTLTLANPITVNGSTTFDLVGNSITDNFMTGAVSTDGSVVTLNGAIGGAGPIILAAYSDLSLTGANSFGGTFTVDRSIIRPGTASAFGNSSVVLDNAALRNDSGSALTIANAIALAGSSTVGGTNDLTLGSIGGTGNLFKVGVDTLTVTGNSTYTGSTTINGGTLNLQGNLVGGGSTTVNAAGTITGSGTIFGTTTSNGGTFAPASTLIFDNLSLDGATNLNFDLQTPAFPGAGNDLIRVNNNLTLDGTLNIAALPGFTTGTYRVINYFGALTDNGLLIGSVPLGFMAANFTVDTATANQVNLILGIGSTVYWDGTDMIGGDGVDGGNGTWNAANMNWTNMTGAVNGIWGSGTGIFQTIGGTVSVASTLDFDMLSFRVTDYLLTDGGGTLRPSATGEIETQDGVTTTINASISGANGINKTGNGTLILGGANSFMGGVTVAAGTLQVTTTTALGGGAFNVGAGTTVVVDSAFSNDIVIAGAGGTGGTFVTGNANTQLTGVISGTGSLTKTGAFSLLLTNANSYAGGTFVNAGALGAGTNTSFGTGAVAIADGASIFTSTDGLVITNDIMLTGSAEISPSNNSLTLGGVVSGTGMLVKTGSGTLALTGANTYQGGTSIRAGTLSVGDDANLGAAAGAIDFTGVASKTLLLTANFTSGRAIALNDNAAIDSGNFDVTLNGVISGAARLTKSGTGTLTLTGTNTYGAGTRVDNGVLSISSDANLGDAAGALSLGVAGGTGGTLRLTGNVTSTRQVVVAEDSTIDTVGASVGSFTGALSSDGRLTKSGTGELALSGNNSGFSGGILLTNGTLTLGSNTAAGTGGIETTGSTINYLDGVDNAGTINVNSNSTNLQVLGSAVATQSGVISETGMRPLAKIGTGALILTAANSFSGLFSINEGAIGVGNNQALGLGNVALADGTVLAATLDGVAVANNIALTGLVEISTNDLSVPPLTAMTLSGVVSGTGTLEKVGGGVLALTGTNTYSGGTRISAGAIAIGADANLGNAAGSVRFQSGALVSALRTSNDFTTNRNLIVTNNTGVVFTDTGSDIVWAGQISGAGSLIKGGTGTLELTNATNSYTGTAIAGGRLIVGSNAVLGNPGAITFFDPTGVLQLSGSFSASRILNLATNGTIDTNGFNLTLNSPVTNAGSLTKIGAGTLSLLAASNYAGGTNLNGGTLAVGNSSSLGTNGLAMANGTTLQAAATVTLANAVTVTGATTIDTQGFTLGLTNTVGGAGSIAKIGTGTLDLSGTNSYGGGTLLNNGTIRVFSNTALGGGQLSMAGATTLVAGAADLNIGNDIALGGAATINTGGFLFATPGLISGAGRLIKTGSGVLFLENSNTYLGGTDITAGTVVVYNGASVGSGTVAMSNGSQFATAGGTFTTPNALTIAGTGSILAQNVADSWTLSGVIADGVTAGTLAKNGPGTVILTNANTYTGGTNLNGGRLGVGDNSALGTGTLAMAGGTTLRAVAPGLTLGNLVTLTGIDTVDSQGFNLTLANTVSGTGTLTKIGSGTLTLAVANSYGGGTELDQGTIAIGTSTSLGGGNLDMAGGTTLQAGAAALSVANTVSLSGNGTVDTQAFNMALTGVVSGGGSLTKIGSGTLTLSGVNGYSGGTNLNVGAIRVTNNLSLGTGTLTAAGGTTLISGAPVITLANTAVLNGAVTVDLTGTTAVLDQMTGSYTSNGSALTLMGPISGAGSLATANFGTLTLAGNNSFAGGVTATTAQVLVTNANSLGTGTLTLADQAGLRNNSGGALTLANNIALGGMSNSIGGSSDLVLTGVLSGASGFSKVGTDTLTLTNTSTYTGATAVNAGTLKVNGALTGGGALTVAGGATLAGTGSITGNVTIDNGGTLSPGNSPGTLAIVGNLTLNPFTLIDYELGQPNVIGGVFNDRTTVSGILTLDGLLSVTNSNAFGLGVYNLFQYTPGALNLVDNGLSIVSLPGAFTGLVQTLVDGQVNLIITAPGTLVQYWDGGDFLGNGTINGGSGTWNALNTNWTTDSPSALNASWQGGVAVFAGAAGGAVTLASAQTAQGLQFTTDGYVLQGAALNFAVPAFVSANGGVTATINSQVTGVGSIDKQDAGTLVLNGANTYAGGTTITGGTLTAGSNTALGSGAVSIGNATLAGANGVVLGNAVTTTAAAQINAGAGGSTFTLAGNIGGAGSITAVGAGNLVLNGANGFAGLNINAGTVTVGTNTAAGAAGIAMATGTTLAAGASGLTLANAITTAGIGSVNQGGNGSVFTLSGMITGAGSITATGAGNLVLGGTNAFNGLSIANGGRVTLRQNSSGGAGGITLAGGTTLAAGNPGLTIGNAVTTTGVGTIDNAGNVLTFTNTIGGAGSITAIGGGNLALNGANGFSGLNIAGGTVTVGTNTAAGIAGITLGGGTTLAAGPTGLALANAVTTTGIGSVNQGTGIFALNGAIGGAGSITTTGAGNLVLGGANGFNGLNITGGGTVTLLQNSSAGIGNIALAGGTTLAAGNPGLVVGNTITTAGVGTINGGATLLRLNGVISGAGSITTVGAGNLALNGANSFNGLNVNAGTVTLGTGTAAGAGNIALAGGTTLASGNPALTVANTITTAGVGTIDNAGNLFTLNGAISGLGSITSVGLGNLVLGGVNGFAGLAINAGRVTVRTDTAAGAAGIAMAGGTTLASGGAGIALANAITTAGVGTIDSANGLFTLGGNISGAGSISKIGSGNLRLNGNNSFTNLVIANGTVTAGSNTAAGIGNITITGGTTLASGGAGIALTNAVVTTGAGLVNSGSGGGLFTLNGQITGAGSITATGTGNLVLKGNNLFTDLTIASGTVTLGTNTAAGIGIIAIGGGTTLAAGLPGLTVGNAITTTGAGRVDSGAGDFTLTGVIGGAGSIAQVGSGNLRLNAANSFTNLLIDSGTVTVGTNTSAGIGNITIAGGATLAAGVTGLTLANAVVTTGAATIDSGTDTLTMSGSITGAGGIAKVNSGLLTLTGASSYTGATLINAGTLNIAGSLGNTATTVASGATLMGNGSIAGPVTVANGGILSAGATIGTLTLGALTLSELSIVNVALGEPNVIAGAFNDLTVVTGDLTLGGLLNVTNSNAFGLGIYELFTYGGALAGGLTINSLPGTATGLVQTLVPGQVNLVVSGPGVLMQFWDGTDGVGNGAISGGSGVWSPLGTNWTGAPPSQLNANWQGGIGVFQGTSGTVTIDGTQSFVGLQFATDGYTLNGGTGGLATNADGSFLFTATDTTATINAPISGSGLLAKQGGGTLLLAGNSSYSGGTDIQLGTLAVGSNTALGTGAVTIQNGAILSAGVSGVSLANAIVTIGGGRVDSGTGVFTLGGNISGAGSISQIGTGNLVLNGANSFTDLGIDQGTVTLGTNTAAGIGGIAIGDGATLAAGVSGLTVANDIVTAGIGSVDSGSGVFTLTGTIAGAGSITQIGTGNLVLNGANSFVDLAINQGTVTLGTDTAAGVGGIAINGGATLAAGPSGLVVANAITTTGSGRVNQGSGVLTLAGPIGGAGSITSTGTGNLILNGNSSFAGLNIDAGTVTVGTNTAAGAAGIAMANGTTLAAGTTGLVLANAITTAGTGSINQGGGMFTLGGPISGAGSIAATGAGNLVLNGSNSYSGLNINAGTVTVGTNTAAGAAGIAMANGTTLAAGVSGLVLANAVTTAGVGSVNQGSGVFTLGGGISGAGSIRVTGAGNLVLNGNNSFAGLNIVTGTVTVGTNTAAGAAGIAMANGTTLAAGANNLVLANAITTAGTGSVNQGTGVFTLGGTISGAGSIAATGAGNLVLNGSNSYNGLNVNAGRVTLGTNTAAGIGGITISGGAILAAGVSGLTVANTVVTTGAGRIDSGAGVFTLNGVISGAGSISQIGTGNLVVNGANSFVNLGINQGTVTVGTNTAAGSGVVTIDTGATLAAGISGLTLANAIQTTGAGRIDSGTGTFTLGGVISGAGSVAKAGTGNLVLNGLSTYTGGTTVGTGRLTVAGRILGPVTVASGATLAGTGTVGAFTAQAGSTVSPGATDGAVGTLSVNGNAVFTAGSTYAVNVVGTTSDRLAVTGTATLGGANVALTATATPLIFGTSYTLVTSTGARTGTFATTSFAQFGQAFNPTLIYGTNDVVLRLNPASIVTLQGAGGTANTNAIAAALDAAVTGGFNPQNFFGLFTQNGAALRASLNQFTGEIGAANSRTALADTRYVREAAFDRLGATLKGGDAATTTTNGDNATTLWARAIGSWTDTDGDGNGAALDIEARGIIAGIDYSFGDVKVGAMFNYIHSDVDTQLLGQGNVESTGGGVYVGYRPAGGFVLGAGAAISSVQGETSRGIATAGIAQSLTSDTDGTVYQLFGEVAYDLAASDTARIEPFARLAYVKYDLDGYSEAGGFAALTQLDAKYDITVASVGVRGSAAIGGSASLRGSLGYQNISGDRGPVARSAFQGTSSYANIRGVALDKSSFVGEAGVDFRIGSKASLGIGYTGVIGKNNSDNGVKATFTLGF